MKKKMSKKSICGKKTSKTVNVWSNSGNKVKLAKKSSQPPPPPFKEASLDFVPTLEEDKH